MEANRVYLVLLSNGSEMFHCWKCVVDPGEVLGCHRTLPPSPECPTDALIKVAMMIMMMMIIIILIMMVMKKMMMTLCNVDEDHQSLPAFPEWSVLIKMAMMITSTFPKGGNLS